MPEPPEDDDFALDLWEWLRRHHHRHTRHWRVVMSEVLGSQPASISAKAEYPDPATPGAFLTDPNAKIAFVISAGAANPNVDATTVAALVDNGDGTCTLTEVAGAPASTDVNLDAVATDPSGNTVSSAASGGTKVFSTAAAVTPPNTDATQVSLTVVSNPNDAASAPAAGAAAPAAGAAATPATDEAAEVTTTGEPVQQAPPIDSGAAPSA
jgi:hypothetical protein